MSYYAVTQLLVLLLVLVPLVSAALVPFFGRAARRISLLIGLFHLGITAAVVMVAIPTISQRHELTRTDRGDSTVKRFQPAFVPGDPDIVQGGAKYRTSWTLFRLSSTESDPRQPGPNVQFFIGVDGLNMWLVALASFLFIPAVLMSWNVADDRPGPFFGWLFLLQAGMIGCFLSFDVILFYAFFELTLIPVFFLIGRWGIGSGRRDAARKFFLYTLAGSLLTLIGLIGVVLANPTPVHPTTGVRTSEATVQDVPTAFRSERSVAEWVMSRPGPITFSLPDLMGNVQVWADASASARRAVTITERELAVAKSAPKPDAKFIQGMEHRLETAKAQFVEAEKISARSVASQFWFFIALMAGFLVKVPVWPFHTWLPAAYGEAPASVTMVLSGVMAKLGTFGILRFVLPLVPDAAFNYGLPVVGVLAAFGIIYAAFCAFGSRDAKLLIAYSSVSHLGFLVLGLFAFNREGLTGATLHMVNHGLCSGALFAAMAALFNRYHTTEMSKFSGLMGRLPVFAVFLFIACFASIGLPGLNNFVSEMMMLAGLFSAQNPGVRWLWPAVVAVIGIFLSAWYMLTMLQRLCFNAPREPQLTDPTPPRDLNSREIYALGLLTGMCLLLGLYPQPVIETLTPDVRLLTNIGGEARARTLGIPYVSDEAAVPDAQPSTNGPQKGMGGKGGFPKGGKGGFPKGMGGKGGFPKGGKGGFPKGGFPKGGFPKGGFPKGGKKAGPSGDAE